MSDVRASFDLTPRQREAAAFRGGNLLLEAVPGSGKTRVIVARCESLLAEHLDPSKILLLTFSRRAVGELQTRISGSLGTRALPDIHTFHGFAARLLAQTGAGGHSRRLLSEPAERDLFAHVVTATRLRSLPAEIGRSRPFCDAAAVRVDEIRRSPSEAIARLRERATPRLADLLALNDAQQVLRERLGVADYDDLVARAVTLVSDPESDVARSLRDRYEHVLVDEFQDTDPLQLALVEHLGAEVFAVGDAAQAIYGFRGASRDALGHAQSRLNMAILCLDESFRCPAAICELARSVWPVPPALHSRVDAAGEIAFRRAASPQDEAALVGAEIAAALDAGIPERQIAVLVRSVEPVAGLVQRELYARGIAVARQGGGNVLDDLAVDAICAALRALSSPAETENWIRLLAHPAFGVAPLALRLAFDATPPSSIDEACLLAEALDARARVPGTRLATALRSAREHWDANDPVRAARSFAAEADVLGFVIAGSEADAQRSSARITELLEALSDVRDLRMRLDADSSSASVFAAFLACSDAWRAGVQAVDDDDAGVRILTVHAAKGLEFDFVVLADAVDGRFPQARRSDPLLSAAELEIARACGVDLGTRAQEQHAEESSLWYVALTRAKRKLLVTWSETQRDGSPQRASSFIPLDARTAAARLPSFRATLRYSPSIAVADPQAPSPARLGRPLKTSAMDSWFVCRRKFYYETLLRIGSDERNLRAKLGTLVHRTINEFHATVRDLRAVESGASGVWSAALRALLRGFVTSADVAVFDSELEKNAAIRSADRLLDRYACELERSARDTGGFEILASEEGVTYEVDHVAFSGRIDRIDRLPDGSLALVDIKTGVFRANRAMTKAFIKLAASFAKNDLWLKETPVNLQLALYRHAKRGTKALLYVYLDAPPKAADLADARFIDRLDIATDGPALAAIDAVLSDTFFVPWTTGAVTSLEPTRNARTCRSCEFVTVCPGYLEDDD